LIMTIPGTEKDKKERRKEGKKTYLGG